jgi:hypothetical protein
MGPAVEDLMALHFVAGAAHVADEGGGGSVGENHTVIPDIEDENRLSDVFNNVLKKSPGLFHDLPALPRVIDRPYHPCIQSRSRGDFVKYPPMPFSGD